MGFKIELSLLAEDDLEQLVRFLAERSPAAAMKVADGIVSSIEKLKDYPRLGHVISEFERDDLREITYKSYRIPYLIKENENTIEVVRIWHGARGKVRLT